MHFTSTPITHSHAIWFSLSACQNGWSYDKTWYDSTIPTDYNWVCAKDLFVTNVFVVGRVTEVAGSFILGQMGDS